MIQARQGGARRSARQVVQAVRAKYDEAQWLNLAKPLPTCCGNDSARPGGLSGGPPEGPPHRVEQPHPVLPQDDHRPAVKELQQKLNVVQDAAGASPVLEIDGIFDDTTHNAVMAFQRAQGLPDNGTVDAATWAALDRAARRSLRDANDLYAHYLIDVEMSPA